MTSSYVAPAATEENVEYILKYDGGYASAVGVGNYDAAIFGSYYPANVIKSLEGMSISSVDVFIQEMPEAASIKIFTEDENGDAGELLAEQPFEATAESWNHVTLSTPVKISDKGLWVGVEIRDMVENCYYIGIDDTPAVAGYGDLCNVGGKTWWSMSELGIDHNFCVRANVIGERTASINWLSLDKKALSIEAGQTADVNATLNPEGLGTGVFEAAIVITSNDELQPSLNIPVYLTNGIATGIDASTLDRSAVTVDADGVKITSDATILSVEAYDVMGRKLAVSTTEGNTHVLSLAKFGNGIHLLNVIYADGTSESFNVAVSSL